MYRLDLLCFAPPFRFSQRAMRQFFAQAGAFTVVAESASTLAGFVIVQVVQSGQVLESYIDTLDVHPDHRRAGIASALTATAERRAVSVGAGSLALHVHTENQAAVHFYERNGYDRRTRVSNFYGRGLDAWVYAKLF